MVLQVGSDDIQLGVLDFIYYLINHKTWMGTKWYSLPLAFLEVLSFIQTERTSHVHHHYLKSYVCLMCLTFQGLDCGGPSNTFRTGEKGKKQLAKKWILYQWNQKWFFNSLVLKYTLSLRVCTAFFCPGMIISAHLYVTLTVKNWFPS